MKSAQGKWQEGKLLGYDGMTFSSGDIVLFNFSNLNNRIVAAPYAGSSIAQVERINDPWVEIQSYGFIATRDGVGRFYYGEGAMGNEGFICRVDSGCLRWSVFMTKYNPVTSGEIVDERSAIFFTEYVKISIDLDDPLTIQLERLG